jgi:hypothetical protein
VNVLRPVLVIAVVLAAAPPVGANVFGINGHIPGDAAADRIDSAGIGWVRIDVLWSLIEPERDVYDWSIYDALVDRLESRGLQIFAGVGDTPGWATSGEPFSGVPDDPEEWREICYLLANRYRGRIDAWGLWNEPNLERFWTGTRQQYIEIILLPGARSIALADPTALVVAPDLAHLGGADWDDWLFDTVVAARDVLDVVSHHVYPSYGWADTVTYDLQEGGPFPFSPPAVRDVLQDAGWWQRPFWLTETGVESDEHGEGTQAEFYSDLLHQWYGSDRRSRNWVDRMFFYELNDGPAPPLYTWGITHGPPGFEEKPAYWSYSNYIENARVFDAEAVGTTLPGFLQPGKTVQAHIELSNTGTVDWATYRNTTLTVEVDDEGWIVEVDQLVQGEIVDPGESHAFAVLLTPPPLDDGVQTASTEIRARMHRANDGPFGDLLRFGVTATTIKPPSVEGQMGSASVAPGAWTTLVVVGSGAEPLDYRWLRNGIDLVDNELYSGVATSMLTINALDPEVGAFYLCEVSNPAGAVLSDAIQVVYGSAAPRDTGGRVVPDGPSLVRYRPIEEVRLSGPPDRR